MASSDALRQKGHSEQLCSCQNLVRMEEVTNPDILREVSDMESDSEICFSWLVSDLRGGKGEALSICNYMKDKEHRQNVLN